MGSKYDGVVFPTTEKLEKLKETELKEFNEELTQTLDKLLRIIKTDNIIRSGDESKLDHGKLSGLGDDDHSQYLLIDGSRAMTGDLDLDGNKIQFQNTNRQIFGDTRDSRDTVVIKGNWDEAEIMGRVWEATGSDLHIGNGYSSVDHSSDSIKIGGGYQYTEIKNQRIENRGSDPGTPVTGQIWFRTDL